MTSKYFKTDTQLSDRKKFYIKNPISIAIAFIVFKQAINKIAVNLYISIILWTIKMKIKLEDRIRYPNRVKNKNL